MLVGGPVCIICIITPQLQGKKEGIPEFFIPIL